MSPKWGLKAQHCITPLDKQPHHQELKQLNVFCDMWDKQRSQHCSSITNPSQRSCACSVPLAPKDLVCTKETPPASDSFAFKTSPFHAAEIQHELAQLSEKVPFLITFWKLHFTSCTVLKGTSRSSDYHWERRRSVSREPRLDDRASRGCCLLPQPWGIWEWGDKCCQSHCTQRTSCFYIQDLSCKGI